MKRWSVSHRHHCQLQRDASGETARLVHFLSYMEGTAFDDGRMHGDGRSRAGAVDHVARSAGEAGGCSDSGCDLSRRQKWVEAPVNFFPRWRQNDMSPGITILVICKKTLVTSR